MARTSVVLFLGAILTAVSGCGGIYVSSTPYYNDCHYQYVSDPWGGYEQQYCYSAGHGGFIPAINGGYYVTRYPVYYAGPRQRVLVQGATRRTVITPGASYPQRGVTVVRTRGSRGTVAPTPRSHQPQPRGPSVRPQRGSGGGGGYRTPMSPGRVRPRKAILEIPAGQLRTVELRGDSFDGATLARYIDPAVPSGKIHVEAIIYGESDRAIDRYITRLRRLKSVELDLDQGLAIVGRERDLCSMQGSQNQDVTVSGVCIDDITILTSREADAPVVVNEQI